LTAQQGVKHLKLLWLMLFLPIFPHFMAIFVQGVMTLD